MAPTSSNRTGDGSGGHDRIASPRRTDGTLLAASSIVTISGMTGDLDTKVCGCVFLPLPKWDPTPADAPFGNSALAIAL
ncbi:MULTISPECIES: hypothetical protein [unclassified Rhizobium]|uniref:hypothetical protein n=1 Tax=unclassified Rhizobium TaxID=2613769 RepID=UPI0011318046|nr:MULTISPECIES: hypothetical protein [unclassified Rhizobium]